MKSSRRVPRWLQYAWSYAQNRCQGTRDVRCTRFSKVRTCAPYCRTDGQLHVRLRPITDCNRRHFSLILSKSKESFTLIFLDN